MNNSRSQELLARARHVAATLWQDRAVRASIIVFLVLRIVTGVLALLMICYVPAPKPDWLAFDPKTGHENPSNETFDQALPADAPLADLVAPWHRYDTTWYVKIAIQGYRADAGIVFPPLYPILIHILAPFCGGNYVLAALLISNVACLIAFILLYKLVLREFRNNHGLALRTLVCLAVFPTAYYLVAGYTETLYLALMLGAFFTAFKRQWWLTGLLACLASLVRLQGAVLILPLGWIAYIQYRPSGLVDRLKRLPAVLGAGVGTLVFVAYIGVNNLGSFNTAFQSEWLLVTRLPWEAIKTYLDRLRVGAVAPYENDNAFILVVMFGLGLVVIAKMRPVYGVYVFSTLILILVRYHLGPQFDSMFRYALLLFPCFIAAALLLQRWWTLLAYTLLTTQWQFFLLLRFTHWNWVA